MPKLFGKQLTKRQMEQYYGDLTHVMGVREYTYSSGRERGLRIVEVKNGSGLCYTVLPDRGMDIGELSYKGIPISYCSGAGLASPVLYDRDEFHYTFGGGMMTTCGLFNAGPACEDNWSYYPTHGNISKMPASELCACGEWQGEEYHLFVSGKVRQSSLFGENLTLYRKVETNAGVNRVTITDRVENSGFQTEEIMILYHINIGHPVLDSAARFVTNNVHPVPRDTIAAPGMDTREVFSEPVPGYQEQVFFYESCEEPFAAIENPNLGIRVKISYDRENLPYLVQWKQVGEGEYVLGIEPGTYPPMGRVYAKEHEGLLAIEPGESKSFRVTIALEDM